MKIYEDRKIDADINEAKKKYDNDKEKVLGVGLMQPNEPLNSSTRKLMYSLQSTHRVNLIKPEVALIQTGYENEFGRYSSSFISSTDDWKIIAKIPKFEEYPNHHYYLIVMNDKNELDVIERISYFHSTETYGYLFNNHNIDNKNVGDIIQKDAVIKTSTAFDEYGNHMDGVNLLCTYMALAENTEDPVVISKSAAEKLKGAYIKKVEIRINDNDIPLNLYGDKYNYKIFPDIGEDIKNNILCSIRRENKDESLFNQSADRLSTIMISDDSYKLKGKVIDINVYSNKQVRDLKEDGSIYSCYENQLEKYINEEDKFCMELIRALNHYMDNDNYKKSYELTKLYTLSYQKLMKTQYIKDKIFSNIYVEIYVYCENEIKTSDKLSNRYGGKGVVSEIRDDDKMPRDMSTGKPVDIIWNQSTCINRENTAQLVEQSLNNISKNLIDYISNNILGADECLEIMIEYFEKISPELANYFKENVNLYDDRGYNDSDEELLYDLFSLLSENEDGFYLSIKPISECVDLDKIREIIELFPWIKPKELLVPIKGSNGKYRYIPSLKKSIIGSQYIYRLKQTGEEKHSATSLSSTNIRNENSKSKTAKMYLSANASTPVRNGEMEQMIFLHLGPEIAVKNLMRMSTSPKGRRCAEQILNGDPYKINIELDDDSKSRSAEKFNTALKTMGLRLRFVKKLKKSKNFFTTLPEPISPYSIAEKYKPISPFTVLEKDKPISPFTVFEEK